MSAFLHLSTLVASTFWQFLRNARTSQPVTIDAPKPDVSHSTRRCSLLETKAADKDVAWKKVLAELRKYRVLSEDIKKPDFQAGPSSVINVEFFMNFIGLLPSRVHRISVSPLENQINDMDGRYI